MEIKCKRCKEVIEAKRSTKLYCSRSCKSADWIENKRFNKKKIERDELIKKSSQMSLILTEDLMALFNSIHKN